MKNVVPNAPGHGPQSMDARGHRIPCGGIGVCEACKQSYAELREAYRCTRAGLPNDVEACRRCPNTAIAYVWIGESADKRLMCEGHLLRTWSWDAPTHFERLNTLSSKFPNFVPLYGKGIS